MNRISFDTSVGTLLLDGTPIAPLPIQSFRNLLTTVLPRADEFRPNDDFTTFGFEGNFDGEAFGINITYSGDIFDSAWLAWDGGISKIRGYNISKNELIADKNRLTRFLSKALEKEPDEQTESYSSFRYKWGDISASAAIASAMVAIGITWRNL